MGEPGPARSPPTRRENGRVVRRVVTVYRKARGAVNCGSVDPVAEIGVNEPFCHMAVSNVIPGFLPRLSDSRSYESGQNAGGRVRPDWTMPSTKVDKTPAWSANAMRVEAESRSTSVLRPSGCSCRSPGPGRLPQEGADDRPGEDAQPTRQHLLLLGGGGRRCPRCC